MAPSDGELGVLRMECRQIARYLLDVEPPPDIVERYVEACQKLWGDLPESAENRWWRGHSWTLALLDAAAALVARESVLRRKTLLVAALLESTPGNASFFVDPPATTPVPFILAFRSGIHVLIYSILGLPVLWWARVMG